MSIKAVWSCVLTGIFFLLLTLSATAYGQFELSILLDGIGIGCSAVGTVGGFARQFGSKKNDGENFI